MGTNTGIPAGILDEDLEEHPDWSSLVVPLTRREIQLYTRDCAWQWFKATMNTKPLNERYSWLRDWIKFHQGHREAIVQVANYVNALKRGGLVCPRR